MMGCEICGSDEAIGHHCPQHVLDAIDNADRLASLERSVPREATFAERLEDGFGLLALAGDFE